MNYPEKTFRLQSTLPWMLFVLLLSCIPFLTAYWATPPNHYFAGALVNPDDFATYISAIRQGSAGSWLFHFNYSPEQWQPKLMLFPYLLFGKLFAPLNGDPLIGYHFFRLTAILFALTSFFFFVKTLFPQKPRQQETAWLLMVFGSGLGWLAAILFGASVQSYVPDLRSPEWTTFMALFHTPHFALGLGWETLFFGSLLCLTKKIERRWILLGIVSGLGLGLTYVYHIPVVGLISGLYLLLRAVELRRIPWREWMAGAICLAPLTLLLFYYTIVANQDPFFAEYARENHIILAPSLAAMIIGAGFLGVAAIGGAKNWWLSGQSRLLPIWILANILLLLQPWVQFRGRFALGLMLPISGMAAWSLEEIILPVLRKRPFYPRFARLSSTPYASLRRVLIFLTLPTTFILPFWLARGAMLTPGFPTYLPAADVAAAQWLGARGEPDELILVYYPLGNFMPRVTDSRIFASQLDFTTDLEEKLTLMERFLSAESTPHWQETFIERWGADYLFLGTYEKELMSAAFKPPGTLIYDQAGVRIYALMAEE